LLIGLNEDGVTAGHMRFSTGPRERFDIVASLRAVDPHAGQGLFRISVDPLDPVRTILYRPSKKCDDIATAPEGGSKTHMPARYAVFVSKQQAAAAQPDETAALVPSVNFSEPSYAGRQRANSLPSRTPTIGHFDLSMLSRKQTDERVVTQISWPLTLMKTNTSA